MFPNTISLQQSYYVENLDASNYGLILPWLNSSNKSINIDNNILLGDSFIVQNKKYIKEFSELFDEKNLKKVTLLKSIKFIITADEEGFYYSNKQYNLYVYGENQKEAENNILDELLFQYNSYAFEDDDKLDSNAKRLKYNLLSIIKPDAKN